jgi:hypothetical protein
MTGRSSLVASCKSTALVRTVRFLGGTVGVLAKNGGGRTARTSNEDECVAGAEHSLGLGRWNAHLGADGAPTQL